MQAEKDEHTSYFHELAQERVNASTLKRFLQRLKVCTEPELGGVFWNAGILGIGNNFTSEHLDLPIFIEIVELALGQFPTGYAHSNFIALRFFYNVLSKGNSDVIYPSVLPIISKKQVFVDFASKGDPKQDGQTSKANKDEANKIVQSINRKNNIH